MSGHAQSTPFDLPGFTLPLNFKPGINGYLHDLFPNALDHSDLTGGYLEYLFATRELLMMRIMESITDKPDWDKKVFKEEITKKWREEISQSGQDVTEKMMDYIIDELQWKAGKYQKTGLITAYDPGVVKSDVAIPSELQQALREAVKVLEDVPPEEKDYHPGSDNQVVDLVHPSLFPLVYGRTRVLGDKLIDVDDCLMSVGAGEVTKVPDEESARLYRDPSRWQPRRGLPKLQPYSRKFQWLPCHVKFTSDEGECRIASYINNLHPAKHRDLYAVIERIITKAIPLWNVSLPRDYARPFRIRYNEVDYLSDEESEPEQGDEEGDDAYWERHQAWMDARTVEVPEPETFKPPVPRRRERVDLAADYREKGLQVIVKLANIELTPENPEYEGGSWHVEGQLNERICATAIYYYDSENITDNTLAFRHRADDRYFDDVHYEQGQFQFLSAVFGFDQDAVDSHYDRCIQDLGAVKCSQGRLLTFPNTLQHQVSPFSLADRSKPGHRKILALFLIDPKLRIISTANVPPQREDWCKEHTDAVRGVLVSRLPIELQEMVQKHIECTPMTMDEAKEYRLELMAERSVTVTDQNKMFTTGGFSLCEH